jgi:hypothetical protein
MYLTSCALSNTPAAMTNKNGKVRVAIMASGTLFYLPVFRAFCLPAERRDEAMKIHATLWEG